jgi:hypothetical protein
MLKKDSVGVSGQHCGDDASAHVRVYRVDTIPAQEVQEHPDQFNVCNVFDSGEPPADYIDVCSKYIVPTWLPGVVPPRKYAWVQLTECSWLKDASRLFAITGRHSTALFGEEFEQLLRRHGRAMETLLQQGLTFVRGAKCSCKYGQALNASRSLIPFTSAAEVLLALIQAPRFHTPVKDVTKDGTLALYFFPWVHIATEYRVFVHLGHVTAISQQVWFKEYDGPPMTQALVSAVSQAAEATTTASGLGSAVADVALLEDGMVYVVELNPFGQQYSSGSALFHWVTDANILLRDGPSTQAQPTIVRLVLP